MEGTFPFSQGFMMPQAFPFPVAAFNPMHLYDRSQAVAQFAGVDQVSMNEARPTRWSDEEVRL
jgi:hypothetical protein